MEALEWEVHDLKKNVKMTNVCPFFIKTPLLKDIVPISRCAMDGKARRIFPLFSFSLYSLIEPADAAAAIVDGILAERIEVFVPKSFAFLAYILKGCAFEMCFGARWGLFSVLSKRMEIVLRELFGIRYA